MGRRVSEPVNVTITSGKARVLLTGAAHGAILTVTGDFENLTEVTSVPLLRDRVRELRDALSRILGDE